MNFMKSFTLCFFKIFCKHYLGFYLFIIIIAKKMRHCAAYGCTNNSHKPNCEAISFFSFPLKRKEVLKHWIVNIRRQNFQPNAYSSLCSDHFTEDCFRYQNFTNRRLLKPGAIPTKFSFTVAGGNTSKKLDHEASINEAVSDSEIEGPCTNNKVIQKPNCKANNVVTCPATLPPSSNCSAKKLKRSSLVTPSSSFKNRAHGSTVSIVSQNKNVVTCSATLPPSSDDEASVSDVIEDFLTMTAAKKFIRSFPVTTSPSFKNRVHGSTVSLVSQNKDVVTCLPTLPPSSDDNCCPVASVIGNCSTVTAAKKLKRSFPVTPSPSVKNREHGSTVSLVFQNKDVETCPSTPPPSSDNESTVSLDLQNEDVMTCPSTPPPSSDDNCCPTVSDILRNCALRTATQENISSVTSSSSVDNRFHESTVSIVSENLASLMKVVIKNGKIVSGTFTVPSTSANNCFPKPPISSVVSYPITASPSSADNCIPEPIIPPVISVSPPSADNCFPKQIVSSVSKNLSDLTTVTAKRGKVESCSVTVSSTDNGQPSGLKTNSNLFRTSIKRARSPSKDDMKNQIKLLKNALRQRDKRIKHLQSLLKAKSIFKMPDSTLNMQKNAFIKVPCLLIRKRST